MFMRGLLDAGGKPYIPISKFTEQTREFDKQCEALLQLTPKVFYCYQWTTEQDCEEKVCALQYLGFKLFRLLEGIRRLMQMRGKVLYNEHCNVFADMVRVVDEYVRHIKHFIQDADELINEAEKRQPEKTAMGLLPVMQRMDGLKEWIACLQLDNELQGRASAKCDELNLHFDMNLELDNVDELRCWTRIALNGITMLAVPSLSADCSNEELADLYDRSMAAFCSESYWQQCRKDYGQKVDRILERECKNRGERRKRLQIMAEQHRSNVRELLAEHGITYKDSEGMNRKAELCRRLYACLNGTQAGMSNDKLCRYFHEEAHIAYLQERIEAECPSSLAVEKGKAMVAHTDLFRANVNEKELAEKLNRVFNHFFGREKKGSLSGAYNGEIDLASILFILMTELKLGNAVFESKGCLPFYNFLKANVWDLKKGYKTLSNRIKKEDGPYRHVFDAIAAGRTFSTQTRREDCGWKNYQTVRQVVLPMVG